MLQISTGLESLGTSSPVGVSLVSSQSFTKVVEKNETALILEDDVLLSTNFGELEEKLQQLQDLVQFPLDILFLEWWFPNPNDRNIPCHEYSELQESKMCQTRVEGIFEDFLGAGDRARIVTARGAKRLLKMHNAFPWGVGEMLPWNIGLHQTRLHTKTKGDFIFRKQFWQHVINYHHLDSMP